MRPQLTRVRENGHFVIYILVNVFTFLKFLKYSCTCYSLEGLERPLKNLCIFIDLFVKTGACTIEPTSSYDGK